MRVNSLLQSFRGPAPLILYIRTSRSERVNSLIQNFHRPEDIASRDMGMILHAEKFIFLCLVAKKKSRLEETNCECRGCERFISHVAFHFTLLGLGPVSVVTFQSVGELRQWKLQV